MSVISDKFFEDKAVGALWDVAVSIKRGNPLPLDKDAVVHGIDELNAVAAGAVSYPGQIIAVVIDAVKDGEEVVSPERVDLYYLDHNKTPRLVAPEVEIPEVEVPDYTGDNLGVIVTKDEDGNGTISLNEYGKAFYKYIAEVKDDEGNVTSPARYEKVTVSTENPWKEGLEPRVAAEGGKFVLGWYEPNPTTIEGVNNQVAALQGAIEDIQNSLRSEDEEGNPTGIVADVDNLENSLYGEGTAEAPAEGSIAYEVNELVDTVGGQDDELGENVNTLWANINNHESRLGTLEGKVEALEEAEDADTTYEFTNGTEGKFTVTPKGGEAQEVDTGAKDYVDGIVTTINSSITGINEAIETIDGEITALEEGKADKATTLAGYGITDAYTKEEVKAEIANADHLKREIVEVLPEVGEADENTIYMIKESTLTTGDIYKEYMLIDGKFEMIGDSAVVLENYYTKDETNAEIKKVDDKFANYNTKTEVADAIKVETDRATGAEEALGGRIDDVVTDIGDINTEITEINGTIDTLATKGELEALQTIVGNNKTAIEGTVATLTETVTTNKTTTDAAIGEINTALEGKASTQSVSDLANLIGETKVETQIAEALESYYTKTEVDNKIGTPGAPAEKDEEGNVVVEPVAGTGIFVNTYSKAEINSLLDEIEGGSTESAASVARQLEEYKGTNNARVQNIENILNDTENAEGETVKGLTSRVGANETAIADILNTKLPAKADQSTVEAIQNTIESLDNTYAKDSELTAAVESLTDLIDDKVAQTDFDALALIVKGEDGNGGHAGDIANLQTRMNTAETKLTGIADGAQVNVIEAVKVNGTALGITDKAVNIDLSGYATKTEITEANYVSYNDTIIMDGGSASLN